MGNKNLFTQLSLVFIIINSILYFIVDKSDIQKYWILNTAIFILMIISSILMLNSRKSTNKNGMTNMMMLSFTVKFLIVATATLIYSNTATVIDKKFIITGMGIYFLYLLIQIFNIQKQLRFLK